MALDDADESAQRVSNLSRAYRVNLNVLALVALFTGAFLVFSLQAQAVIARRTELAFLRVGGVTASELQRLLVVECLAAGIIGSLAGLALGSGLAALALAVLGGDLGSGFFAGTRARLSIDAGWRSLSSCSASAPPIAGSWVPARDAARVEPALALKAGVGTRCVRAARPATWPAFALLAAGGVAALLPPLGGLADHGATPSIALLLLGAIMLQPRLAQAVFSAPAAASSRAIAPHPVAAAPPRGSHRRRPSRRSGWPASSRASR